MNLVELDHALRKLRLSGMADRPRGAAAPGPVRAAGAHRFWSPRSSATSCSAGRIASSLDAYSRPASAMPTARSTASISTSTRR